MIKVSNLSVKFDSQVLKNVNLHFSGNSIYGIIGKSGSGKTTLLKTIAGLVQASEGEIFFEGKMMIGPNEKLVPGYDEIQLVNQDFGLDPYHTVYENVKEKILSRTHDLQVELVDEFLDLVELTTIKDRQAILLSGGEKQRLAIARALACEPKVLLLDEPFVHLDQRLRWKILHYLNEVMAVRDILIILVSHDGAEIMGFAKKVIHIENSQVVREDSTRNMYYFPENKAEGELMGEINEVVIKNKSVLFRPNEYSLINADFNIKFESSVDVGIAFLNYFITENKERILLSSQERMEEVKQIKILK